jgi:hypothetical protein
VTLNGINSFDNNYNDGLYVESVGMITVNNLRANNSQNGLGAYLKNNDSAAPQGVTINGYADFDSNTNGGLKVESKGAILVNKLQAKNSASGYGAYLNNNYVGATAGVSILGAGANFKDNALYGLWVESRGLINITSPDGLDASGNGTNHVSGEDYGALLDNSNGTGGVTIGALDNYIGDNYGNGLDIRTNGAIALGNITANGNGHYDDGTDTYYGFGARLDNSSGTAANVTFTGNNTFNDNWQDGLIVYSKGVITTNNLEARGNGIAADPAIDTDPDDSTDLGGSGVWLDNCSYDDVSEVCTGGDKKAVNVNGTNTFDNNWDHNLVIYSDGAVKANNIDSTNAKHLTGVSVTNNYDLTAPQTVAFSGDNNFSNSWNSGLEVQTYGAITLNNVSAHGNGQSGTSGSGVVLYNDAATTPADVKITGESYFMNNWNNGLEIYTDGNIALNSIHAYQNGQAGGSAGALLDNSGALPAKTVTLTGENLFYANNGDGLYVNAAGNVTLNNVVADKNTAIGVSVISAAGNVLVACGSMVNNNTGWDIDVVTVGKTITLNGVLSYSNTTANSEANGDTVISKFTCP